jgi:hypothetical protein
MQHPKVQEDQIISCNSGEVELESFFQVLRFISMYVPSSFLHILPPSDTASIQRRTQQLCLTCGHSRCWP